MRKRIVVVGAGFAGIAAVKRLSRADADITLIDRRNYHLFQPLLYQVATADLSPADIAWPTRSIFARQSNVSVVLANVTNVDADQRTISTDVGTFPYDFLVLACGAETNYFGNPQWAPHAPGLKDINDATEMRKRILLSFEQAETCAHAHDRERYLNFVVIGGGPTGVEMAGAIAELAKVALVRDFRRIDPRKARIILLEAGERILSSFPSSLSAYTARSLSKLGVEVMTGQPVTLVNERGVHLDSTLIPSATIIWAAGVRAEGLVTKLGMTSDRVGRIKVNPDLSAPDHPEIFVVGDAAAMPWKDGIYAPGLAPAAKQAGTYAADTILAKLNCHPPLPPFRYRHEGSLATIGRNAAVVDLGRLKLTGPLGWWFWGLIHIYFLINTRAATLVMLQWFWAYLTRKKGARLITGPDNVRPETDHTRSKAA